MTTWHIPHKLRSPVPLLPAERTSLSERIRLKPRLGILGESASTRTAATVIDAQLAQATGDESLRITTWESHSEKDPRDALPAPLRGLSEGLDAAALEQRCWCTLYERLALTPRFDPAQPPEVPTVSLAALHEALAFALLEGKPPWDFSGDSHLSRWSDESRRVLSEREVLSRRRKTPSALLNTAYQLLEAISQARAQDERLEAFETRWQRFNKEAEVAIPAAFTLAFWWEAAYRLSTLGDFPGMRQALERQEQAARTLAEQVPQTDEAIQQGLWRHHRSRLAYYEGEMGSALRDFAREWALRCASADNSQPLRDAQLRHHIAGVLIDMGLFQAAEAMAQAAHTVQEEHDVSEQFKSAGRRGEIALRQGDYAQAEALYQTSWERQKEFGTPSAQTAVFRGHTAQLRGELEQAEAWYRHAETLESPEQRGNEPYYRIMGEMGLARRRGDTESLQALWGEWQSPLAEARGLGVLPATAATGAAVQAGLEPASAMAKWLDQLVAERFWPEAAALIAHYYEQLPSLQPALDPIMEGLQDWARAITETQETIPDLQRIHAADLPPESLLEALRHLREDGDLRTLSALAQRPFPFVLVWRGPGLPETG